MEEETVKAQPIVDEYQGKPVLRIPTVENPDAGTAWHWMSFGKTKARAIVKYIEAIRKFAGE